MTLEFGGYDDSEPGDSDEEDKEKELRLQAKERSGKYYSKGSSNTLVKKNGILVILHACLPWKFQ